MMLHKVSAGELVLTDGTQQSLWKLMQSERLKPLEKVLVMDLLTKGGVCERVQRSLAQCLRRLPMKVPVEKLNDRIVIAMCAKIYQEDAAAIDDLARSVREALRSQLGVCFVEPEKSLEHRRRDIRLLARAEGIIASYQSGEGVRRLTIPAGCSDVEAAEALEMYQRYWSKRFNCEWRLFRATFWEELNDLYRRHDAILRSGIERLCDESGAVEVSRNFSTTRRLEYHEAYFVRYSLREGAGKLRALGLGDADLRDLALIIAVDDILQRHRGARTSLEAQGSLPFIKVAQDGCIKLFQSGRSN